MSFLFLKNYARQITSLLYELLYPVVEVLHKRSVLLEFLILLFDPFRLAFLADSVFSSLQTDSFMA